MCSVAFLRALALSFLALGFCGTVVKADHSSNIPGYSNLKDRIDFLGRLCQSNIKDKVIEKLQDIVDEYVDGDTIPGGDVEDNLQMVLENIPQLCNNLLKDPNNYGKYSDYKFAENAVDYYVSVLASWLPILHSDLYYLFFQTDEDASKIHGGAWREHPLTGATDKMELHQWLTSKGFQPDDLNESNLGSDITPHVGVLVYLGGPLSHAQYGLFLLSPWHDSNLASAVLFLQEFCSEATEKRFGKFVPDDTYDGLKGACESLTGRLLFLTDAIDPIYNGTMDTYRNKLKPEYFIKYAGWLRKNLDGIIVSLEQMLSESEHWTKDAFANARSPGPFKYGFVFKDSDWDSETFQSQLKASIDCLIGPVSEESLEKLKEHLQKTNEGGESPEVTTTMGTLRDLAGSLEGRKTTDGTVLVEY